MVGRSSNAKFLGLWKRAQNLSSTRELTPALVEKWAKEAGFEKPNVSAQRIGRFHPLPSVVLEVNGEKACFPCFPESGDEAWRQRRELREMEAEQWNKVEWFAPLWIPMREIRQLLNSISNVSNQRALELFDYHTSTLYTLPFEAICIEQVMSESPSLSEFVPLAREAYLGAYSGNWATSIASLIPVIEGGLTRMAADLDCKAPAATKIDHVLDRAIKVAARFHFNDMWVPDIYLSADFLFGDDDLVFVFLTFKKWLKDHFFCKTDNYKGSTWLNRHMFAHGTESSWQEPRNFTRLLVALATLAVAEAWFIRKLTLGPWLPEMSPESELLWQQALFRGEIQMKLKLQEQKIYQENGRLVPALPNDNGALLRKAILTEDCMNDLVRPLREAGWQIRVSEADDEALYITVEASCSARNLKIALLYSCATDSKLYRQLAQECEVILYRGAPYHEASYARGVTSYVHVGPVLGWQPPQAHGVAKTSQHGDDL